MPSYKVLQPGFIDDKGYSPRGRRNIYSCEKALKPCPSWLEPIKEESAAARKKREAEEAKQAKINEEEAEQNSNAIAEATFIQPVTETL